MASQVYFPTIIDHTKNLAPLSLNRDLKREILQIQKFDRAGVAWSQKNYHAGFTSYSSMDKLHLSSPNFALLEKLIYKKIKSFVHVLEWDINPNTLRMDTCWVNIMPKGVHHSFHIHPNSVISGTYYVDAPDRSSPLNFEDPRLSMMMLAPPKKLKCKNSNKSFVSILPKNRDLVLFESWLRHEVPTNLSKKVRISVSFNYDIY